MKRLSPGLVVLIIIAIIYALETLLLPTDARTLQKYQISDVTVRVLGLTILIPMLIIWGLGWSVYAKFRDYAKLLGNEHEGKAMQQLAIGIYALVLWLPIISVISNALSYIYHQNPSMTGTMIVMTSYVTLALFVAVMALVWRGARYLVSAVDRTNQRRYTIVTGVTFVTLSAVFLIMVALEPKTASAGAAQSLSTYVSKPVLLLTYAVPYIAAWYLGLSAVQNIYTYSRRVKGIIYRQALQYIANGLGLVLIATMLIRYTSFMTRWLDAQSLHILLTIIYCLILFIGVGYWLLAKGSKRLRQIEEA